MEPIYQTFWGDYIDLSKITHIKSMEDSWGTDRVVRIYIYYQLMEQPIESEVFIWDYEQFYNEFIEDWKQFKRDNQ